MTTHSAQTRYALIVLTDTFRAAQRAPRIRQMLKIEVYEVTMDATVTPHAD
ncbi:hypothetical protein LO763_18655 [Glycomyces sp. A-F 0318]|uniref:hypothetical protein n=1 Tax=Glycomyces amatae TaxID=2881355 RepID=UPI001E4D05D1|nr:hypothetical protein [Glycomyces amatae]MCD0445630.1 hypothetical protein [Glycomyces amatae]